MTLATVDVAQVIDLQLLQQLYGFLTVLEYRRHNHHRRIFIRYHAVLELQTEGPPRLVEAVKDTIEKVDHHLACRHDEEQGEYQRHPPLRHEQPRKPEGYSQRAKRHNPHVCLAPRLPFFRREKLPTHMTVLCVGPLDQPFHIVIFLHPRFLAVAHYLCAVVVLRLVVHLAVHARLLTFQHLLGVAHPLDQLRQRQFSHLLQRVEDIHHLQVLLGRPVQTLHVRLLGHPVVMRTLALQLRTQLAQRPYKFQLHQWQQPIHLLVVQVVLLTRLHLRQVAEHQPLVHLPVAPLQVSLQQVLNQSQPLPLYLPATPLQALQLGLHHLLLLADDVVVVQHPLISAAHRALPLRLLHQQHVISRDTFHTVPEYLISALHNLKKYDVVQKCKDTKKSGFNADGLTKLIGMLSAGTCLRHIILIANPNKIGRGWIA